jgi:general nucleoside transport system permease protein
MEFDLYYFAVVINSTLRMTTPVLFAALGFAICNKAWVFNIALEGQMLIGAFFAIVVNYYTHNVFLSVMGAVLASVAISTIVAFLQVKLKARDMVVGTSINLLVLGGTSFLLSIILGVKGVFTSPTLRGLPKISIPVINEISFLGTIFENLTILDYLAVAAAILMHIYLNRTVNGFRLKTVGQNKEAAESLSINAERMQIMSVLISGVLCGMGGALLTLGRVKLFTENITAGRGFIAMAASSLGNSNPISVLLASIFFGFSQALGTVLQNTMIKSQLTMALPYVVTIIALVLSSSRLRKGISNRKGE